MYLDEGTQQTVDPQLGNRYSMIHRQWYEPIYQLCIGYFFSVEFQCLIMLFR